jgi:general secretion pathway protein G
MFKKGFTLVELIIVISIVALLSTIGITTYSSVQKDARNIRRKADLKELKTALEAYKAKNSDYPTTANAWFGTCATYGSYSDTGAGGYIPNLAPEFIPKLPRDPRESKGNSSSANQPGCSTAASNCYLYRSNGTDYKLMAHCTPEGVISTADPYYNALNYSAYTYQLTSSNASIGW